MRGRAAVTYLVAAVMLASVLLVLVTIWLVGARSEDFIPPMTTAALKSDRL